MDNERKLIEGFRRLVRSEQHFSRLAKVEEVIGTTCRVSLWDSHEELASVRLLSVADDDITNFWLTIPRVGSLVVVSPIGADGHVYVVTVFSEIEQLKYVSGETSVTIDSNELLFHSGGKIAFKNSESSLKELLEDIIESIKTLTLGSSVGPTTTPLPPTIQKCEAISQKINTLFN